MLTIGYICLGYIIIGLIIGITGFLVAPIMDYDGDNEVLFRLGDAAEDFLGTVIASYVLALPIILVVCCYLVGRAFGELV